MRDTSLEDAEIGEIAQAAILNMVDRTSSWCPQVCLHSPLSAVRNLGVTIDSRLTMADHVSAVCRACYF